MQLETIDHFLRKRLLWIGAMFVNYVLAAVFIAQLETVVQFVVAPLLLPYVLLFAIGSLPGHSYLPLPADAYLLFAGTILIPWLPFLLGIKRFPKVALRAFSLWMLFSLLTLNYGCTQVGSVKNVGWWAPL